MKKKKYYCRLGIITILTLIMAAGLTIGCADSDEKLLDPDNPVSLTVWHYYHGAQQNAFDALVTEFNNTVGREEGIFVQGVSLGSVSDLEEAVMDSLDGKVGANDMPDIFSTYADTAYEVEKQGALANLSDYISDEELSEYVDSYIDEGRIAKDGSLRIFPVAKSTEVMMLNLTDWQAFSDDTGVGLYELETIEGVVSVAEKYYEWSGGKAFYGRDAMANYICIGMMQLGNEIFEVEDGNVTLNTDKESLKRIWDCYYVPYVKGYFAAYGSFRSDDVKTGDLIAYTGSTTSAMYFPDEVELNDTRYGIDYLVMPAPVFEGGENYAVQQGAGMVVTKSDRQHEYASVEFLKWFTLVQNNLKFASSAGYLPVLKEANSVELLDEVIFEQNLSVSAKTYDCLCTVFNELGEVTLYTNKSFEGGTAARKVLEYALSDKALADRELVEERLGQGIPLEEATAEFLTQEAFEEWYQDFCNSLKDAVNEKINF